MVNFTWKYLHSLFCFCFGENHHSLFDCMHMIVEVQRATHQHSIMSLYSSRGHPGGGGSRTPLSTILIVCSNYQAGYLVIPLIYMYLHIRESFKWFVSQTPYLVHDTTKAPHITGCRVLLVIERLYSNISKEHWSVSVLTSGAVHLTGILPPWDT